MKTTLQKTIFIAAIFLLCKIADAQFLVKDILPGSTGSIGGGFFSPVGNKLFFLANSGDGNGSMLWRSDSTAAGTFQLTFGNPTFSTLQTIGNLYGTAIFQANISSSGTELWKSDGTVNGTVLVKDINPGTMSSGPSGFATYKNKVYFSAASAGTNSRLWVTDGTTNGTSLLNNTATNPNRFTIMNDTLYFGTNSGELWRTDGTGAGTVLVKDINPGTSGIFFGLLTAVNNKLFFVGNDGTSGNELWVSDGTEAGTVLVKDIKSGNGDGVDFSGGQLTAVNGILFFVADDGIKGQELWKSDGTAAGTIMVKEINTSPTTPSVSPFSKIREMNGMVYFAGNDAGNNIELWKSNGTEAGTVMVKDINVGGTSNPSYLININGMLFFGAAGNNTGGELWKSDGTEAGTVLVKDINPSGGSDPNYLTNVNGILFFAANDGVNGGELWAMDAGGNVSVVQLSGKNDIEIYPNPASENFTIEISGTNSTIAEIFNFTGTLLHSIALQNERTTVGTEILPAGVYFIKIKTGETVSVRKFIKQ